MKLNEDTEKNYIDFGSMAPAEETARGRVSSYRGGGLAVSRDEGERALDLQQGLSVESGANGHQLRALTIKTSLSC